MVYPNFPAVTTNPEITYFLLFTDDYSAEVIMNYINSVMLNLDYGMGTSSCLVLGQVLGSVLFI